MATARSTWIEMWEQDLVPSPAAKRSAARVGAQVRSSRYYGYYGKEATARLPHPAPEARPAEAAPELKVVRERQPRWGLVVTSLIFMALLLAVAVVVPVIVNSATTGLETAVGRLEVEQQALTGVASTLSAQISALSSPERITAQASELGLGPALSVHYLEAGSGTAALEGDTTVADR